MTLTTAPYCYTVPHPAVSTEVVIFTIRDQRLTLLLVRRRDDYPVGGKWALPGGGARTNEDLDSSARRLLREETGADVYLEQLYTFGRPTRDPRERVISVAYYALIPSDKLQLKAAVRLTAHHRLDIECLVIWFVVRSQLLLRNPELSIEHSG